MDAIQADTVILEIVERNLKNLAEYPFIFPAPWTEASASPLQPQDTGETLTVSAAESPQAAGYLTVTGELPSCGDSSPVYLRAGGYQFEASPVGSGGSQPGTYPFTAYLPAGTALTGAQILWQDETGAWLQASLAAQG